MSVWEVKSVELLYMIGTSCDHFKIDGYNSRKFYANLMVTTGASQVVLAVKNPPANAGDLRDTDLVPGLGRSPGRGHGNQYSCLENPMDRRAWWASVHRVAQRQTKLK